MQGVFRRPDMCKYRYAMLVKAWQQENGDDMLPETQQANALSLAIMPKQQAKEVLYQVGVSERGRGRVWWARLGHRGGRGCAVTPCAHAAVCMGRGVGAGALRVAMRRKRPRKCGHRHSVPAGPPVWAKRPSQAVSCFEECYPKLVLETSVSLLFPRPAVYFLALHAQVLPVSEATLRRHQDSVSGLYVRHRSKRSAERQQQREMYKMRQDQQHISHNVVFGNVHSVSVASRAASLSDVSNVDTRCKH